MGASELCLVVRWCLWNSEWGINESREFTPAESCAQLCCMPSHRSHHSLFQTSLLQRISLGLCC